MFNFVYITTNLINNKQYIGSHSTNNKDDGYIGSGRYFLKSISKYGKQHFKREILQECENILEARNLEGQFIEQYNTLAPKGYNLAPNGGLGFNGAELSDTTKDKISKANTGKIRTPEMRENISKAAKGKQLGENHPMYGKNLYDLWINKYGKEEADKRYMQWGEKIRIKRSGKNHHYYGKHRDEETNKKISESLKGFKPSEETKQKLSKSLLNVKKIVCEHCKKEFTPWGLKHHQNSLNRKNNRNI